MKRVRLCESQDLSTRLIVQRFLGKVWVLAHVYDYLYNFGKKNSNPMIGLPHTCITFLFHKERQYLILDVQAHTTKCSLQTIWLFYYRTFSSYFVPHIRASPLLLSIEICPWLHSLAVIHWNLKQRTRVTACSNKIIIINTS